MEKLLIPKPQPNFPHEDVEAINADIFEQLLFESSFVEAAHDLAEQQVVAFRLGHQTLRSLSHMLYMDYSQQHAFSYGATIYEALSVVVRPVSTEIQRPWQYKAKIDTILALAADPFMAGMTMRDQEEQLRNEAPITAGLVDAATQLSPQLNSRYVMMGAAMERDIDRDMMQAA